MGAEFEIVSSAVSRSTCAAWLALVEAVYRSMDATPRPGFVPESSSLRVPAVPVLSVFDVWSALSNRVTERCVTRLGSSIAIDADQCWVRRQYPAESAPPRHRPHGWHQDGALGFDFAPSLDAAIPDDALLRMVTCWIALTPCGTDAPGLDIVTDRVDRMLAPAQLTDDSVERRWPLPRRVRPALEAGDALVFSGNVLHRTHVSASMTRTRTSIELRLFQADAIPHRVAGDDLVVVCRPADPSSRSLPAPE